MRSSRPMEGRARNYGYQESLSDDRLRPQMGGFKHPNLRVRVECNYSNRGVHGFRVWVRIIANLRLIVLSQSER